jgi:hypothetical protein
MISVRKYADLVEAIANRFSGTVERIDIVESISEWCRVHEIENKSPFSPDMCLRNNTTNKCLILLDKFVSDDERQSIIDAMILRGSTPSDIGLLNDDLLFLKHLVLHECSHAIHQDFGELDCDVWAFKELKDERSA